jgi:molybdenum cofactor cytidylyltransferase
MGQHKLLLELAGRPVAAWSVRAASASQARDVLVVLGRSAEAVEAVLPHERARTIHNLAFAQGQGTSLARAVTEVADSAPGLIILLADQPFMDHASIDQVIDAANAAPDKIVVGSVGGAFGHPVYLPRRVFAELEALDGDRGARDILARERDQLIQVALSNVHAHLDVDTPEDYARAAQLAYLLAPEAS